MQKKMSRDTPLTIPNLDSLCDFFVMLWDDSFSRILLVVQVTLPLELYCYELKGTKVPTNKITRHPFYGSFFIVLLSMLMIQTVHGHNFAILPSLQLFYSKITVDRLQEQNMLKWALIQLKFVLKQKCSKLIMSKNLFSKVFWSQPYDPIVPNRLQKIHSRAARLIVPPNQCK